MSISSKRTKKMLLLQKRDKIDAETGLELKVSDTLAKQAKDRINSKKELSRIKVEARKFFTLCCSVTLSYDFEWRH